MTTNHAPATSLPTRICYFFQHAARKLNARFRQETIERHEEKWMAAVYLRRALLRSLVEE
jgi:hypothetical protein